MMLLEQMVRNLCADFKNQVLEMLLRDTTAVGITSGVDP